MKTNHQPTVLAKFPNQIAPWKRGAGRNHGRAFFYALAEEAAHNQNQQQCFSRKIFDEAPQRELSHAEVAALAGNLFGAGSDTSSSTLITFVLACCAFPETLPKAWEELDRVVGPHRSPDFEDEPNLPYVKALVKEVLRWRSVAVIGGQPHAPIQDDYYKVSHKAFPILKFLLTLLGLVHPEAYLDPGQCLGNPS